MYRTPPHPAPAIAGLGWPRTTTLGPRSCLGAGALRLAQNMFAMLCGESGQRCLRRHNPPRATSDGVCMAQEQAIHDEVTTHVGTEYLLLGLLKESEGAAAKMLRAWTVTPSVRQKVEDNTLGNLARTSTVKRHPRLPLGAKRVLQLAPAAGSRVSAPTTVCTEHILLGLLREGHWRTGVTALQLPGR